MRVLTIALTASLVFGSASGGQNVPVKSPDDLTAGVLMLPFRDGEPLYGGWVLYAEGVATSSRDDRFGLEGLAVTQPVVVSVLPKDPKVRLTLSVGKLPTEPAGRLADTGDEGLANVTFFTQGDARVTVRSTGASTPYQLMVWVGPEVRPTMPSPFKAAKPEALRVRKGGDR